MSRIATILAATDFSRDGDNAVRRAALLAREIGSRLTLLHVVDATGFKPLRDWLVRPLDIDLEAAQARTTLRRLCDQIVARHDVAVTADVRVGDPHGELLHASRQADLLVLGRRGRNPLKTLVLGGTADRLLRTSRTPVLVVKREADAPYQRVLVPVDLTPHGDTVVQVAASLVADRQIHVFHAIDSPREAVLREADVAQGILREARLRDEARVNARLRRSVTRLGLDGRRVSFSLAHGAPVALALQQLCAQGADLVVVGKQGASVMAAFLLGSVSRRLLAKTDCDTVIVPHVARKLQPVQASAFARAVGVRAARAERSVA